MINTSLVTDKTLIGAVLSSAKNAGKLKAAGYETVGSLKGVLLSKFMEIGVGEVTLEEIQALVGEPEPEPEQEVRIEENDADIQIRSPHAKFSLQIVPGDIDRGPSGRGMRPVQPVYLVCADGRGSFSRRMWFLHLFGRENMREVEKAEEEKQPWRVRAYEWLKKKKAHGQYFQIMSD